MNGTARGRALTRRDRFGAGVDWTGRACLFLFAGFAMLGTAPANIGLGVMTLLCVVQAWPRWREDWIWPPLLLGAAALVLVGGHLLAGSPADPERAGHYLRLWLVLPVAWWVSRLQDPRSVGLLLAAALAGFILGRLLKIDPAAPLAVYTRRDGLGLPVIAFGQYCAAGFMVLVLLLPELWRARPRGRWQVPAALGLAAVVGVLAVGLVLSRARGAWLALVLVLPPAAVLRLWLLSRIPGGPRFGRALLLCAAAAAALAAAAWWAGGDLIAARLTAESSAWQALLDGRWQDVGTGSIGLRVQMAAQGLEWWLQRPWLGWGAGSVEQMMAGLEGSPLQRFNDLHSVYVHTLVELGVAGLVLLLGLFALAFRGLVRGWRRGRVSDGMLVAVAAALALHLLAAATNYRLYNVDWQFYWFLFGGLALAGPGWPRRGEAQASRV